MYNFVAFQRGIEVSRDDGEEEKEKESDQADLTILFYFLSL